jgi:hypothetical protein
MGLTLPPKRGEDVMAKPAEYRGMSDEQPELGAERASQEPLPPAYRATDRLETPSEIVGEA